MSESIIDEAVRVLRAGGVVALPTETVYGLAASIDRPEAVRRIYGIKGRPATHPLIVHVPSVADIGRYAAGDLVLLERLAARFWPGPLTAVVERTGVVPDVVTGGQPTVALRIVDHPLTAAILKRLGSAVAAPSANRFGRVSPTTAEHVRADLGDDVDMVVDGGPSRVGIESTIVDLTGEVPAILRAGMIGARAIGEALGVPVVTRAGGAVRAPGMLAAHYAPRVPLFLIDAAAIGAETTRRAAAGQRVGVLTLPEDPHSAARALYATLRALDTSGYDALLATLPADIEANAALRDRLRRAAAATAGPPDAT
jgi:L-threonylcarbamoyladenylate synthase